MLAYIFFYSCVRLRDREEEKQIKREKKMTGSIHLYNNNKKKKREKEDEETRRFDVFCTGH